MDDEIKRRDLNVFFREFTAPARLVGVVILSAIFSGWAHNWFAFILALLGFLTINAVHSWFASKRNRFHDNHFRDLWEGCVERHHRFEQVYERGKKKELSGIVEMPQTIIGVKASVYKALRKADLIAHELSVTEGDLGVLPKPHRDIARDAQSQELLQVADRNVVEYRQGLNSLMAGVQRTEAQAAVFMTTIDSLRMRMLGHRLVGRSPEMGSHELLAAMAEAKLQLQSIDKALDELDLGLYPQRIPTATSQAVSGLRPPPPPGSIQTESEPENLHQENRNS